MDFLPILKPDKYDKYRALVLGEKKPTPKQAIMMERFAQAWAFLCNGYTKTMAAKALFNNGLVDSVPTGMRIVKETEYIYGMAMDTSKKGQKAASAENQRRIALKLEKQDKLLEASIVHEKADKLLGLDKEAMNDRSDPKEWMRPIAIVFTTDDSHLEKTEDVGYEELGDYDDEEESE